MERGDRPNVLLLTIDTLRSDMLGCYGMNPTATPNLDRLAEKSVLFQQAITGGSWTQAAFPVLLTSTAASRYGGCLGPLSADRPSLIEALRSEGYDTAAFVTSPLLGRSYGYQRGFRFFQELIPQEQGPLVRRVKGGQRLLRLPKMHQVARVFGRQMRPARLYVSAEELTDVACAWLANTSGPYFAWLHYMDVHWPYHIEESLESPAEIAQAWQDLGDLYQINKGIKPLGEERRARYVKLYTEAVRYTDFQVGRLLDFLESRGNFDNTVIIVVSDHGEEFMERRRWGHFEVNLCDEIIRVPLLIYVPGLSGPCVVQGQVGTLDIMPTICELCHCLPPDGVEGKSLAPLWQGAGKDYDVDIAVSEMWRRDRHIVALRTEQHKYIWDSREPDNEQLFDLVADPGETQNIVQDASGVVERFRSRLQQQLQGATSGAEANSVAEPEHDARVIQRLHDLGYLD